MFDSWKIDSQGAAALSRGRYLVATFGAVASAFALMLALAGGASAASVTPTTDPGNPDCQGEGYDFGFKIDEIQETLDGGGNIDGTYFLVDNPGGTPPTETTGTTPNDPNNSVTIENFNDPFFDWTATLGIDAVIVKGGTAGANIYKYDPESEGDTNLTTPTGQGISHIEFCYDYEVDVNKTAVASFDRTHAWDIEKSFEPNTGVDGAKGTVDDPIVLSDGQSHTVSYKVVVTNTFEDSNYRVSGTITIDNNTPLDATIESVDDVIQKLDPPNDPVDVTSANVRCPDLEEGGALEDGVLPAGETLVCGYRAGGLNGDENNNHVDVTTSGDVGGGSADRAITWPTTPTNETDECVDVSDTNTDIEPPGVFGDGEVCSGDAPATFEYTKEFTFTDQQCGPQNHPNTATSTTNDTGTTDSDTETVYFDVRCEENGGCTLTQGYWKTHSREGPAPYDDTWALLGPDQEGTAFFLSDKTYYEVLWTSPSGNAYYILAHAYIAAKLNDLNGADFGDAQAAFNAATALFNTYTPNQIKVLRGSSTLRAQFISLAQTLDDYNNGLTLGPGHCSEQPPA